MRTIDMSSLHFLAGAFLLFQPALQELGSSGDWPQFLGPQRTGQVAERELDLDWSDADPEVLWVAKVGEGFGGAAIKDGEVFVFDRDGETSDVLRVFDLETGAKLWSSSYEANGRLNYRGTRSVPAVDGDSVYTLGGFGHVTCFDRKEHKIAWSVDLAEEYGGRMPMFGWSGNPVLLDGKLIVPVLGAEVGLLCLDPKSGEELWITESVGFSHSTPALMNLLGKEQLVFLSTQESASGQDLAAPTTISSFDPQDGGLIWRTESLFSRLPVPPPVQIGADRLFISGGYRAGSKMLRLRAEEEGYVIEEQFSSTRGSQTHVPLRHGDHLYVLVNENWNDARRRRGEGGLMCLSLDGKEVWRTGDDPFFGRGNAILVGDHLLIQDGHSGVLRTVRATPDSFQLIGEANIFEIDNRRDHQMWAPMALSGNLLVMRSHNELRCVQL